jgi:site-specific DNA-methyltransferase (adenine-specific)
MGDVSLHLGDCLEVMATLSAGSIDAIITDLPYGTTACKWDEVIPFAPMWEAVKHVLKPRGVFVTTASQPFTSRLVNSNLDWFKYDLTWNKGNTSGFLNARKMPLRKHEDILVFAQAPLGNFTYNPIMTKGILRKKGGYNNKKVAVYSDYREVVKYNNDYYPTSILDIGTVYRNKNIHPTQKPVALYEYLIRTYTNPGETVLDICAGSGTTGEAAHLTGRNAILIEKDPAYFEIMKQRIAKVQRQPLLFGDAASAGVGDG